MATASSDVSSALKFAKLNGTNYRSWAFNIRLYLESMDLFEFADGSAESPGEDASDEVRRKFNSRAKKAWTYICLAVEPEQQIHVRETTTAKEAWDALQGQFARKSLLQKVRLRQQYYSCKFRVGDNMLDHISNLKSLHDQLKEMGVNIDDKELAMTLLASLPEKYKPLITALDAVGEADLSYEKVKNMILNDEDRANDTKAHNEDAFTAQREKSKLQNRRGNNENRNKSFQGKCYHCQQKGHFAKNCPKKTKNEFSKTSQTGSGTARCAEEECSTHDDEEALTSSTVNVIGKSEWIIDSGATQHMTFERNNLEDYIEFKQPSVVNLGDNRSIFAYGKGTYHIKAVVNGKLQKIALRDVLYLPELDKNLLSVRAMVKLGAVVSFENDLCKITRNSKLLAVGVIRGKLYVLKIMEDQVNIASEELESDLFLWHCRLGHLGMDNVIKLANGNMVKGIGHVSSDSKPFCEGCVMGKQHRCPYPKGISYRAKEPFELIHSDVCGPMSESSIGGSRYYVTFIDDFTRYTCVYFLKNKSEVLDKFKDFHSYATNVSGKGIKVIRTDNGGEYCSTEFESFLKENGIVHQLTVPYNPAQNGVAERMNRTVMESARAMMSHSNLPNQFWAEAVNTSVYIRNRCPTNALDSVTPYECLFKQKPDVGNLHVFGCVGYVHIPDGQRTKLGVKSTKSIFVGYPEGTKGYKLYDPSSRKFIRSRDVVFQERKFYDFGNKQSVSCYDHEDVKDVPVAINVPVVGNDDENPERAPDDENANAGNMNRNNQVGATYEDNFMEGVRQVGEKRVRRPPARYVEECHITNNLTADNIDEPSNVHEAITGEYSSEWKNAMESEYNSLLENNTWDLVPPPENKNVIGSKWVYKVKRNADGSIERFKARLVAQGYSQSQGIDYEEVFAPVARYNSIRSLLAVANVCDWEIHQMDVKTAFLQGELEEEIYLKQPDGFIDKDQPDHVCKLKKSIYGLKQAARCWNNSIDSYLLANGYEKSTADPCIYIKSVVSASGKINFVIIAIYVDDMIFLSNNVEMLKKKKAAIAKRFKVEDLGEIHHVLGMTVTRNRRLRTLSISQKTYLQGVLKRFEMENCKAVSTPLEFGKKYEALSKEEKSVDVKKYQMAIGCLNYATLISRPDLAVAVGVLSKFMANPGLEHWKGVKRIFRYIQGTLNYGLLYTSDGSDPVLRGYSDADWGGDLTTRRSTTGYVFQIEKNTVSWCSKRQGCVSKSTTEAEYVALSTACQEGIWLRRLLDEISIKQHDPTVIYEDNQGAIQLSKNPKFHSRTKHIDVSYHYIREQVNQNTVSVKYCASENMLADIMTKGLSKVQFQKFRDMLGVGEIKE